ncbi:esterase FE4-like [Bombyx mandarina]|uniref:Carboxylic ester hydrolase n=2 Tax=Bombyx TaxID=7090 RepID=A0A8R2DQS8_BOMMO|nr:esterase FE4 [Bombyx mori]XP_028035551.1 esterase FE4-like [Bombyx mandarina]
MLRLVALLGLLSAVAARLRIDPLVDTQRGLIRGLRSENGKFSKFLGIPYALVDENNPFGPSVPHPGFEETFEAYDDSVVCPQVTKGVGVGSLQCLNLNVYVPNTATSRNKRPVMVWIHGGGFTSGSGTGRDYSFDDLVRHDVIVVSVSYRLGLYGFLCLDSPDFPGNQGMKDQVLALRWIKENIEAFGGDASKITLFGESAGGVAVELHLLTDQDKLFNQVIIQSGSAFFAGGIRKPSSRVPIEIASQLGFETDNFLEAVKFLADQDPHLVVAASTSQSSTLRGGTLRPCLENKYDGVDSFLSDFPENLEARNIPAIYGVTNKEFLTLHAYVTPEDYEVTGIRAFLERAFNLTDNDMEDHVRHFYIGDETLTEKQFDEFIDFASDYYFNYAVQRSIKKSLADGNKEVYYYVFSYDGGRNAMKEYLGITAEGAAHADELGYLLAVDAVPGQHIAEEDQLIIDRITTLWANFAKYGNPTPEPTDLLPVVWSTVEGNKRPYLDIDTDLQLRSRPFHHRMAFWDLFYKLYGELERKK